MIGRALDAGTPASWVAGDEVYGADPPLPADLERRQIGYVLAMARSRQVATGAGVRRADQGAGGLPRAAAIVLLTKDVAARAGPHGIGVNCLAPETTLTARNLAAGMTTSRTCPRLPRA